MWNGCTIWLVVTPCGKRERDDKRNDKRNDTIRTRANRHMYRERDEEERHHGSRTQRQEWQDDSDGIH